MTTPPDGRGRFGLAMALLAAAGVVIAAYLTWQHLAGIGSLAALAYFTYLEVAVIHAICAWCVTYAVTVLAGWLLALAAYRSTGSAGA